MKDLPQTLGWSCGFRCDDHLRANWTLKDRNGLAGLSAGKFLADRPLQGTEETHREPKMVWGLEGGRVASSGSRRLTNNQRGNTEYIYIHIIIIISIMTTLRSLSGRPLGRRSSRLGMMHITFVVGFATAVSVPRISSQFRVDFFVEIRHFRAIEILEPCG